MAASPKADPPKRRLRRPLIGLAMLVAALWFAFFDSHSLAKRIAWHHESQQLLEENTRLQQEINVLEARLAQPLSDEVIEKIAREQYGMRRPGETVYRIEE
ncbi:MAG TPA: septum formation initiator family protein [Rhodothermales bacterium]|nr:septum formation initiator family protein [Rhodothermales bacterium]